MHRFLNEMHEGDWVITYDTSRRQYILGQVAGAAEAVGDDESEFELKRKGALDEAGLEGAGLRRYQKWPWRDSDHL